MSNLLYTIYEKIYGSTFSYQSLDNREKLQKAIYLLENMGSLHRIPYLSDAASNKNALAIANTINT